MKKSLFITLICCLPLISFAQQAIKGKITDAKGNALASVTISLKDHEGTVISFSLSNEKGLYGLPPVKLTSGMVLVATAIGYEIKSKPLAPSEKNYDFSLAEQTINLKTVEVKHRPSITLNGDTINYRTADFAGKQDRTIGEVLKKMPGIRIEDNGKISYNGKDISNLYIDGDNLLDNRYSIGTKIPHGAVDKVQVIEKDQPIKLLRKNNMSQDVALNLVLKDEAKMKAMGEASLGAGTPERFDANVLAMLFKKKFKSLNTFRSNNIGSDPGLELTAYSMENHNNGKDNNKPEDFLSTGAAGVPLLPPSRTLFNKAAMLNLNNMYKINKDLQFKVNVGYLYDQQRQQYSKLSETYLPGQTITYNESQYNTLNPQKLHGQLNINGNAEGYFLNNTLMADYRPNKVNSSITTNGIAGGQQLRQEPFEFSNEFNYIKKLKSSNAINFYSYLTRSNQSEVLKVTPGLNEDLLNQGKPYAGLNQHVELPTLFNNNYASMSFVNNWFTQHYKAGFNIQHQQLKSALYRIQNNQTTELVSKDMTNNLDWLKSKFYTEAGYDYNRGKLKISLLIPVSYTRISYQDLDKRVDKSFHKIFADPSVDIRYKTGPENEITATYQYQNKLGGIDDVYRGTILKNYRSLFANNAPVSESKSHQIGAAFNLKKSIQMLFFNIRANYSITALNTLSAYNISNNVLQRIVLPLENKIRTIDGSTSISKYLYGLSSTINAGIDYDRNQFEQLQNTKLLPFTTQNYTFKAGIDTRFSSFINWSYKASYLINSSKSKGTDAVETSYRQLNQQSTLTFTMLKSMFVTLSAEHIFTKQPAQQDLSYLFADFNIRYQLTKYKTDLEFGVTNLANVKKFEAVNITANALTSGTYRIPGRVALLKATFSF